VRALVTLLVLIAGCSSAPSGTLVLSWRFADGRDCFTAGATAVEARTRASLDATPLSSFRCFDGLAPATVSAADVPGTGTLTVDARTPLGADLYRGQLSLDASPPGTGETREVTLYAVAAQ
jgi:hypothetical protein